MAYPITGELGKVNSVTASTDLAQLFVTAAKTLTISYNMEGSNEDISGHGDTVTKYISGIRSWGFDFTAKYPQTAPKTGNTGLVTYTNGSVQYVESYSIDLDFGEEDITTFAASGPTWRAFRPSGRVKGSFTYTTRAPNDTAATLPATPNATGDAIVFKLCEDGAADPTIGGTGITRSLGTSFGGSGLVLWNYAGVFSDSITETKGTNFPNLLSTSSPHVIGVPNWGDGTTGPDTVSIVTQSFTSRTYTGYGYLRTLRIACAVGGSLDISGSVKGQGALTLA
jgi:hypothetical protein